MSVNCVKCGINRRTGPDLKCDRCRTQTAHCENCGDLPPGTPTTLLGGARWCDYCARRRRSERETLAEANRLLFQTPIPPTNDSPKSSWLETSRMIASRWGADGKQELLAREIRDAMAEAFVQGQKFGATVR